MLPSEKFSILRSVRVVPEGRSGEGDGGFFRRPKERIKLFGRDGRLEKRKTESGKEKGRRSYVGVSREKMGAGFGGL